MVFLSVLVLILLGLSLLGVRKVRKLLGSKKLEKAGTVDFKKTPCTEGGDKVQAVSTHGSRQVHSPLEFFSDYFSFEVFIGIFDKKG